MSKYFWRKYQCGECSHIWDRLSELDDPLDECPQCSQQQETAHAYVNKAPGMRTNVSRAAELTSRMLETDYGIPPSMQVDNAREGDSYVKMPASAPPIQYMGNGPSPEAAQQIVSKQLAMARQSGGIGPQNMNGVDFVKQMKIPDPRKTAEFMGTRDKI